MAPKGFNSILFDFDSIIDKETSILKYFYREFKQSVHMINFMRINYLTGFTDDNYKFERMYGEHDLFQKLLVKKEDQDRYETLIDLFFERDQKDIFDGNYAFPTDMKRLLHAYRIAGNGVISTAVRCDNKDQVEYLHKLDKDAKGFVSTRKDVDMSKYGRLVVGNYKSALEYIMNEPKSILILNFRENYDYSDSTLLRPELVINLGDINDIRIISAYQDDDFIKG